MKRAGCACHAKRRWRKEINKWAAAQRLKAAVPQTSGGPIRLRIRVGKASASIAATGVSTAEAEEITPGVTVDLVATAGEIEGIVGAEEETEAPTAAAKPRIAASLS